MSAEVSAKAARRRAAWLDPLLGLLIAQAQAAWNRTARESGAAGKLAATVVLLFVALAALPVLAGMAGAGFVITQQLAADARAAQALGLVHLALVAAVGAWGGLFSPVRTGDDGLRVFPVPASALLAVELIGGLLSLPALLSGAAFLGLGLGVSLRLPLLAPVVLVLALQGFLGSLLVAQLIASGRRALAKRLPLPALLAGAALLAGLWGWKLWPLLSIKPRSAEETAALVQPWLHVAGDLLPSGLAWRGVAQLAQGHLLAGLWPQLLLLAITVALAVAAAAAHVAEQRLEGRAIASAGRDSHVFHFDTPVAGLSRLLFWQVWGSRYGKLLVFAQLPLSLICVFVFRSFEGSGKQAAELAQRVGGQLPAHVPWLLFFTCYQVVVNSELLFNQFGLDRAGVRTLLLLPISPQEIVLGKLRGLATLVLVELCASSWPLFYFGLPGPRGLVGAAAGGVAFFLFLFLAGFRLSLRFPRRLWAPGEAPRTGVALSQALLQLLIVPAVPVALWGLFRLAGEWFPLACAGLALALAGATALAVPGLGRALSDARERLVEGLS